MRNISFVIYEPSYLIRKGLSSLLESMDNIQLLYKQEEMTDWEKLAKLNPDYILLNDQLINNYDELKANILKFEIKSKFIKITTKTQNPLPYPFSDLININGDKSAIVNKIKKILSLSENNNENNSKKEMLSDREINVLKLVASGFSNKEIAEKLFISTHTVITHRKNITNKLGIKSISGLTVYAVLNKLIDLKDLR